MTTTDPMILHPSKSVVKLCGNRIANGERLATDDEVNLIRSFLKTGKSAISEKGNPLADSEIIMESSEGVSTFFRALPARDCIEVTWSIGKQVNYYRIIQPDLYYFIKNLSSPTNG